MDINREIAEKVMGWNYYASEGGGLCWVDIKGNFTYPVNHPKYFEGVQDKLRSFIPFNPAERIDHAFEVRDKIKAMPIGAQVAFRVSLIKIIANKMRLTCREVEHSAEIIMHIEPEDICLAALEAVKE